MAVQSKEVLIIEDAADVRMTLRKILENIGISVTECASVEDAIVQLAQKIPHVILLDLNLEGLSGFDFLKMKSKMANLQSIPVIVVSGLADRKSVFEAITLGAQDYLVKPFPANQLIQKVRKQVKDMQFLSYLFPEGKRPNGTFYLKTRVCQVCETYLTIESLARLSCSQTLNFSDETKNVFGVSACVMKTDSKPPERTGSGTFHSKVNVIGVEQSLVKKFRNRT
ncbi:MAG: response regulator [Bdellovibrionales bacterium]|nr:response regulator [Oligoflexia bacterium]